VLEAIDYYERALDGDETAMRGLDLMLRTVPTEWEDPEPAQSSWHVSVWLTVRGKSPPDTDRISGVICSK
jgi:hypothetical protein